jgi:hypothetical protein
MALDYKGAIDRQAEEARRPSRFEAFKLARDLGAQLIEPEPADR